MFLVNLGFKDLVDVGNLVMKVPLFFHWQFPLGTYHTEHTRPLAYVYELALTSKHTYSL